MNEMRDNESEERRKAYESGVAPPEAQTTTPDSDMSTGSASYGGSSTSPESSGGSMGQSGKYGQSDGGQHGRQQQSGRSSSTGTATMGGDQESLIPESELSSYRDQWDSLQSKFVDEPKEAVEEADRLIEDLMKKFTQGLDAQRSRLEKQWSKGENVSTEDLRNTIRKYRSFMERLLAA